MACISHGLIPWVVEFFLIGVQSSSVKEVVMLLYITAYLSVVEQFFCFSPVYVVNTDRSVAL